MYIDKVTNHKDGYVPYTIEVIKLDLNSIKRRRREEKARYYRFTRRSTKIRHRAMAHLKSDAGNDWLLIKYYTKRLVMRWLKEFIAFFTKP